MHLIQINQSTNNYIGTAVVSAPGQSVHFTYKNEDGKFDLDGQYAKGIYKFPLDNSFNDDIFQYQNPMSFTVEEGDILALIFKALTPGSSFWLGFSLTSFSYNDGKQHYPLLFSFDGSTFRRFKTVGGTDRGPLENPVPDPATVTGPPIIPDTGGHTAPDGKKAVYPDHSEGYFGTHKGYAYVDLDADGFTTLKISGSHSGVTGSTKFSGTVIVSGYHGDAENVILNKPQTKYFTVGANAGSGVSQNDQTWSDFPPIEAADRNNVRHVRVLMSENKSSDNFVDVITGMLDSAGIIVDDADALYKKVKSSEIGKAVIVALA